MNLNVIGCSFRTAPVELRERLVFDAAGLTHALSELTARYGCEAALLGTCNRVELYLGRADDLPMLDQDLIAEFLGECRQISTATLRPHLYEHCGGNAVLHLMRVTASLDSLVVGEAQIAGQVKEAFESAQGLGTTGPLLNALFNHALRAAKRVRSETGIAHGHVSVSSVAVDYVRQVFDRFDDKTVLVIGAGKMGRLTLRHLREMKPHRIRVTNRSPEKALDVAQQCGGNAVPWEKLDSALAEADIVLSTTGSPEMIVTRERYQQVLAHRGSGTQVILDIAVPRDFDPAIHDGDRTCVFNIDDLTRIREQTLAARQKHIAPAEAIVEQEQKKFLADWNRRRHGPVIAQLTREADAKRKAITEQILGKLNGKLTEQEKAFIEGGLRLFQNQLLHGPINALHEASREGGGHTLLEAIRKLFGLGD